MVYTHNETDRLVWAVKGEKHAETGLNVLLHIVILLGTNLSIKVREHSFPFCALMTQIDASIWLVPVLFLTIYSNIVSHMHHNFVKHGTKQRTKQETSFFLCLIILKFLL